MSGCFYECTHCGKNTFKSQRGLTQHQKTRSLCLSRSRQKQNQDTGYFPAQEGILYTRVCQPICNKRAKQTTESSETNHNIRPQKKSKDLLMERMMKQTPSSSTKTLEEADSEFEKYATDREDNSGNEADISEDDADISDDDDDILVFDQSDDESVIPGSCHNNRVIMLEFREYLL